ncbi:glycosyltransferase family 39 protein [Candidatus Parcubacteria bacterium]|nr:glycosyltransferase family 39 protein [Candidatus Parcubacteria bacterium]
MLIKSSKLYILILLLLIIALAGFFRLWQIETIPPGIYPDEAINANQAISEPGKIFYPENHGREGLFINLIALSFSVFGISIWSFKIVSALFGILTILGLYLLTKELFFQYIENRSQCIALLSSFFLATSFWHINFSHIGFRAILVPLILTFSFYLLFYGFRTKKTWAFILAGIIFGVGFHTYIAFRLAVLIIPVILILWWLIYKRQNLKKKFFLFTFSFLLFTFIVAAPIGFYFLENPENFVSRTVGVSIFSQANPIKAFGESLITHLAMFNIAGDYNWRHNISGFPVLFWPVGILFLIGIFLSLKKCLMPLKLKDQPLVISYWLLITWWFIMLLPGILTIEGIPHCLRCIGAIPPTFIFAGIGGEFFYRNIKKIFKKGSLLYQLMILVSVLLVICFVFLQFNRYFNLWARNPEVAKAFSKECAEIGNYLNSFPKETQKYVIINESGPNLPLPVQSIIFIQRTENKDKETKYIFEDDIAKIKIDNKKTIIVLMSYDEKIVNQLKIAFPEGELKEKNKIWAYELNE